MNELATWIVLIAAAAIALVLTRVNPTSWQPRRVRWVIIVAVVIGAAVLMELGLSTPHGVGISGVPDAPTGRPGS